MILCVRITDASLVGSGPSDVVNNITRGFGGAAVAVVIAAFTIVVVVSGHRVGAIASGGGVGAVGEVGNVAGNIGCGADYFIGVVGIGLVIRFGYNVGTRVVGVNAGVSSVVVPTGVIVVG